MNYYSNPPVLTESDVNQLVNLYDPLINEPSILTISLNQNALSFTNNDYVWFISTTGSSLGYLTLPLQLGSNCLNGPPLNYLTERNSICNIDSKTITNLCSNPSATSTLSLAYFINNFRLIPVIYILL